jgi:hypothetical protein
MSTLFVILVLSSTAIKNEFKKESGSTFVITGILITNKKILLMNENKRKEMVCIEINHEIFMTGGRRKQRKHNPPNSMHLGRENIISITMYI